jgi:small subunit ribosomal protein S19
MPRSLRKGFFCKEYVVRKVLKAKSTNSKVPIKIWARGSSILPDFIGHSFQIHNGNQFVLMKVQENHVGYKFGEFAVSKKFGGHSGSKTGAK